MTAIPVQSSDKEETVSAKEVAEEAANALIDMATGAIVDRVGLPADTVFMNGELLQFFLTAVGVLKTRASKEIKAKQDELDALKAACGVEDKPSKASRGEGGKRKRSSVEDINSEMAKIGDLLKAAPEPMSATQLHEGGADKNVFATAIRKLRDGKKVEPVGEGRAMKYKWAGDQATAN